MKKSLFGVYRGRVLIYDPKRDVDAVFKSKREADLLAQSLNQSAAGYYVAEYYGKIKANKESK